MWLLLFLLFSNVRAQERPPCANKEMLMKCKIIASFADVKKCAEDADPECAEIEGRGGNKVNCPTCIPSWLSGDMRDKIDGALDKIDPAKRCFIEGMVEKCKYSKVPLELCDGLRPTCQRHEITWTDKGKVGKDGSTEAPQPPKMYNISCPTCVPVDFMHHMCKEKPTEPCRGDNKPEMKWRESKSLCPSCFKIPTTDECGADKRKACAGKLKNRELEKCVDREVSMKKDCCFSCIPAMLADAEKKKEMVVKCVKKLKDLPDCEDANNEGNDMRAEEKKVGARDGDGCRSCAPAAPKRAVGKKCAIEDFRKCKEISPTCDVEEEPLTDRENLRCCPPCVRPASKAHLLRVIACRKLLPECDDDDSSKRSTFLPGEACPICEPKRPACAKACGAKSVCVRARKDGEVVKKCVKKRRIKMILKLRPNITEEIQNADKKTMTRVLKEFVSRFCERNGEAERCDKFKEKIQDSLECIKKKKGKESNEIEIEVEHAGEDESAEGRRLLADTDAVEQFVNDAAKDDPEYVESSTLAEAETPIDDDDSSASTLNIFFISVFFSTLSFFNF